MNSQEFEIDLQLFAGAASAAGSRTIKVPVKTPATVSQLQETVIRLYPDLKTLAEQSRWSCDEQFVSGTVDIGPTSRVAMIPPVSGG